MKFKKMISYKKNGKPSLFAKFFSLILHKFYTKNLNDKSYLFNNKTTKKTNVRIDKEEILRILRNSVRLKIAIIFLILMISNLGIFARFNIGFFKDKEVAEVNNVETISDNKSNKLLDSLYAGISDNVTMSSLIYEMESIEDNMKRLSDDLDLNAAINELTKLPLFDSIDIASNDLSEPSFDNETYSVAYNDTIMNYNNDNLTNIRENNNTDNNTGDNNIFSDNESFSVASINYVPSKNKLISDSQNQNLLNNTIDNNVDYEIDKNNTNTNNDKENLSNSNIEYNKNKKMVACNKDIKKSKSRSKINKSKNSIKNNKKLIAKNKKGKSIKKPNNIRLAKVKKKNINNNKDLNENIVAKNIKPAIINIDKENNEFKEINQVAVNENINMEKKPVEKIEDNKISSDYEVKDFDYESKPKMYSKIHKEKGFNIQTEFFIQ